MAGPIPMGPFKMPMFRDYVPEWIRPWLYVFTAAVFQFSGGIYPALLNEMMGSTALTREDIMMILFFGIVGVNMPFPFLFRFKFHFTNKQMLTAHALIILLCNLLAMNISSLPLLCIISYISGFSKLCGTFECMSNIQLWMTHKRDFTIFFPELYIIVLGDIQLSSWAAANTNFIANWHAMHWLVIGLLLLVLLIQTFMVKHFRPMKPMPLFGIDWLGCLLWSALLLEVIYVFNYGEYYNWLDSKMICGVLLAIIPTAYFCIGRMRHIHHAYISRQAWKYKNLPTVMGLFLVTEVLSAAPDVIQNALTINILHYDYLHEAWFNLWSILGIVLGCGFTWLWTNRWKMSYIRLLAIGFAGMVGYHIMMYGLVAPGVNIEKFYLPTLMRNFGYAVVFCALTIYLEEIMPFEHFFMGLTIIGMIRTGIGQAVGSAVYSFGMRYFIADNSAHYSGVLNTVRASMQNIPTGQLIGSFMTQMQMISIKQLFGITCVCGCTFVMILLMYDVPVRSTLKKMPYWEAIGRKMKKRLKNA